MRLRLQKESLKLPIDWGKSVDAWKESVQRGCGGPLIFNFLDTSFNFDFCASCWRVERF